MDSCELPTLSIVNGPSHGSLTSFTNDPCKPGNPNSDSFKVTYSPVTDYTGPDTFTYKLNDGTADSNIGTVTINISDPNPTKSHVGDLDRQASAQGGSWKATVTMTVHDANHNLVPNATLTGSWSGGFTGSGSCKTVGNGQCTVSSGNIAKKKSSVTFTLGSVTHATLTYQSSSNHDPDGDSNGTLITINKP